MGHYFKYLGNKESVKKLWQNRESLNKYLNRLKQLMRRNDISIMEPSEKAICDAMQEVEKIGASESLTKAIIKLQEAKELVSDYIDQHTETQ